MSAFHQSSVQIHRKEASQHKYWPIRCWGSRTTKCQYYRTLTIKLPAGILNKTPRVAVETIQFRIYRLLSLSLSATRPHWSLQAQAIQWLVPLMMKCRPKTRDSISWLIIWTHLYPLDNRMLEAMSFRRGRPRLQWWWCQRIMKIHYQCTSEELGSKF